FNPPFPSRSEPTITTGSVSPSPLPPTIPHPAAPPLALALHLVGRSTLATFRSLFRIRPVPRAAAMTTLLIQWGKHKFHVDFTGYERVEEKGFEAITLAMLKERCKDVTSVPINAMKLLHSGAIMKDDTAPLSSFGLHPNAKIILMGTKPDDQEVLTTTTTGNPEEHALLTRISATLSKATTVLLPQIDTYEQAALNSPPVTDTVARKRLTDTHNMLSEQLMQLLLQLDGIAFAPEFEAARQKRREAVRTVQGFLDRLDRITAALKSGGAPAQAQGGEGVV
ncbi:hypothetical protein BC938DRAFT_481723, partial [Jimgerdemannia flammicorona]